MRPSARVQSAIEILDEMQATWRQQHHAPADALMHDYFKSHRFMGSKDRAYVGELVYFILRNGAAIEWWLEKGELRTTPRLVAMLALVFLHKLSPREVGNLFDGQKFSPSKLTVEELDVLDALEGAELIHEQMPVSAKYNFPDWMEGRIRLSLGDDFDAEMTALNQSAPVDIRVNTLKADRADLILALDREGYDCTPTPHSKLGVRLQKRMPVFTTQAFRDGWFEMQDEGSQIVAALVEAEPGQKVVDFCAGAGGKTLAIAARMENKGRILALDTNERRLKQMHKRLTRAGVDNVQVHTIESEQDQYIKRHKESADWVVVDAPCSGSGTWRRNPDLKWRFDLNDLRELKDIQQRVLRSAARLVKPGGRLVYITCSLFNDENEGQVKQFLVDYPQFRVAPPPEIWSKHTHSIPEVGSVIRLTPHKDGTDGFFAAILQEEVASGMYGNSHV